MTEEKTEQQAAEQAQAPAAAPAVVETNAAVNPLEHSLVLQVSAAEVNALTEQRLKRYGRTARMHGFRPGHVPARQVRAMYGMQAFDEALNEKVSQAWADAARASGLAIVGAPQIQPEKSDDEGVMRFTAKFEVMPEIPAVDLSALSFKRYSCEVNDESVDRTLKVMREQRATYAEAPEGHGVDDGDRVTVNFKGTKDGEAFEGGTAEGHVFLFGRDMMLPDFEAGIKGMKKGEKKTFPVQFPENYGPKDLQGAAVEFEAEVTDVEVAELPEVNDEFAKNLGIEGGVAAMREEIKKNLEREVKARLEGKLKSEVFPALTAALSFPVPQTFIADQSRGLLDNYRRFMQQRGMPKETLDKIPADTFAGEAERQVRLGLYVEKLVEDQKLAPTEEQVKARAAELAASYEEPKSVEDYLLNDQASRQRLFIQIREENVVEYVLSQAKTEDVAVEFDKLMKGDF